MRKLSPMLGIDLEQHMRTALFESLRNHCGPYDQAELLARVARSVVPPIWPEPEPDAVAQFIELVADLPELLTQEPEAESQQAHLHETPLRLVSANVLALAVSYGKADLVRFPDLGTMSQDALLLYGIMRKRYVTSHERAITLQEVLKALQVPPALWEEKEARAMLFLLMEAGVVEQQSQTRYQLTLFECNELLTRYHLEAKCHPLRRSQYEWVRQVHTRLFMMQCSSIEKRRKENA